MPAWSTAEINTVRRGILAGKSAAQIADSLDGRTRRSVLGIMRRNGDLRKLGSARAQGKNLPKRRDKPNNLAHVNAQRSVARRQHDPGTEALPDPAAAPYGALFVTLADIESGQCRWPVNDRDVDGQHLFCGLPTLEACASYCAYHQAMAVGDGTLSERRALRDAGRAA